MQIVGTVSIGDTEYDFTMEELLDIAECVIREKTFPGLVDMLVSYGKEVKIDDQRNEVDNGSESTD